jgi:hypothetical protein
MVLSYYILTMISKKYLASGLWNRVVSKYTNLHPNVAKAGGLQSHEKGSDLCI